VVLVTSSLFSLQSWTHRTAVLGQLEHLLDNLLFVLGQLLPVLVRALSKASETEQTPRLRKPMHTYWTRTIAQERAALHIDNCRKALEWT
jgi:hypothetical protein